MHSAPTPTPQQATTAQYAKAYIERLNLALVQLPPGKKAPTHSGWNRPGGWFPDAVSASKYYNANPAHGIGVVLAPSKLCSLDVDNVGDTRLVLGEFGIDIDALADASPTVVGNPARFRIMFTVPEGEALGRKALSWPNQNGDGKDHVVFELRAGDVQDVLPPSLHPDTGKPYTWRTKPTEGFSAPPDTLLAIWRHWDVFKPQAEALCPWIPKRRPPDTSRTPGNSVIEQFIAAHPIEGFLERYGYKRMGKRWLSPHSSTGLPGVSYLDDNRVFIHHASDPLCSEHPVNAFDLWCHYEHGGDVKKAVKEAARLLGLPPLARIEAPQAADGGESAPSPSPCGVELIRGDSIKPEPISWLWEGWLAGGKLHVIAGAPGTGKTTLALGLAASVTVGGRWPDGTRAITGDVLIWSGEDSPKDTLLPRLYACGANLARVHFIGRTTDEDGPRPFDPAHDFAALALEAARLPNLRLVIVDPIVSAIKGDSHKNAEVRNGLQPLVNFGEGTGCAIVGISHFSKGTAGRDPVERVTGSLAFGALARLVFATVKESEENGGGRLLVRSKSNIGPDGGGFRYELRQVELSGACAGITASRPEWGEAIEGPAREILATAECEADPEEQSATDEAAELLRAILTHGRVEIQEARKKLKAEGFTEKQIRSARERLGVKRERSGYGGRDYWQLPYDAPRSCPGAAVPAHSLRQGMNGQERNDGGMNDGDSEGFDGRSEQECERQRGRGKGDHE